MNKKKSRWYLWTGLVLMALFFIARVVLYGLGLIHVWGLRSFSDYPKMPRCNLQVQVLPEVLGIFVGTCGGGRTSPGCTHRRSSSCFQACVCPALWWPHRSDTRAKVWHFGAGYVLNLYWFSIIVKAAHKALLTKRHQEEAEEAQGKKLG